VAQQQQVSVAIEALAAAQNPGEPIPQWIPFLAGAAEHNITKLRAALAGHVGLGLRTSLSA